SPFPPDCSEHHDGHSHRHPNPDAEESAGGKPSPLDAAHSSVVIRCALSRTRTSPSVSPPPGGAVVGIFRTWASEASARPPTDPIAVDNAAVWLVVAVLSAVCSAASD